MHKTDKQKASGSR